MIRPRSSPCSTSATKNKFDDKAESMSEMIHVHALLRFFSSSWHFIKLHPQLLPPAQPLTCCCIHSMVRTPSKRAWAAAAVAAVAWVTSLTSSVVAEGANSHARGAVRMWSTASKSAWRRCTVVESGSCPFHATSSVIPVEATAQSLASATSVRWVIQIKKHELFPLF